MCTFHLNPLAALQPVLIHTQLKPNIDATPMGRLALSEEIADAVVFLASSRSSYMVGVTMIVGRLLCSCHHTAVVVIIF